MNRSIGNQSKRRRNVSKQKSWTSKDNLMFYSSAFMLLLSIGIVLSPIRYPIDLHFSNQFNSHSSSLNNTINSWTQGEAKYSILEIFARDAMDWNISTTPIPISTPSSILKSILAKEMDKIPKELRYLAQLETVPIQEVRNYVNQVRYNKLVQLCSNANEDQCRKWVNEPDPEFGITPLHLAESAGDQSSIEFLKFLGADTELLDTVGRKPQNMSFRNFIENSKRSSAKSGFSCDIPVVEVTDDSTTSFKELKRLINEGEPVLMKNIMKYLKRGDELTDMDMKKLVEMYADSKVTVGEVPYADVFRLRHSISTLQDYYNQHVLSKSKEPLYIFQKNSNITQLGLDALSDLVIRAFPSPNLICPVEYGQTGSDSIHFFLGAENSGAPLHIHADAINLVVSGRKRWFMYPPTQSWYSRKHVLRWLNEDYKMMSEDEKPLECIQEEGDAIYVPFDWSHAVLNVADQTFGFALELLNRREVFASLPSLYQSCK